ncbi:MAG: cysteine dioxygenase family protein [Pyrinomonadaceae bacterium]
MSTNVTVQPPSPVDSEVAATAGSLKSLVNRLRNLPQTPTLEQVDSLLEDVELKAEELRPYRSFKTGNYARHRVFRNEHVELLVLCWRPGQRTPIHDHNGSHGAVRVCEGVMWETMFELDGDSTLRYKSARQWVPGDVTDAAVPDIHQLGNPEVSGQDMVTLHLYAPPLGVLNTYKVGSSEVGRYSPEQFMDGAGI